MSNLILPAKQQLYLGEGAITKEDVEFTQDQAREAEEQAKRYPQVRQLRLKAEEMRELADGIQEMYERSKIIT